MLKKATTPTQGYASDRVYKGKRPISGDEVARLRTRYLASDAAKDDPRITAVNRSDDGAGKP